jgi:TPR repeat protein
MKVRRSLPYIFLITLASLSGFAVWRQATDHRTTTDPVAAHKAWMNLAQQGDAAAQAQIARFYLEGIGVPRSDTDALVWARKSAEQHSIEGQSLLGLMYHLGRGVERNDTEAMQWIRMAAERGHAGAQYNLGVLYDQGYQITKNDPQWSALVEKTRADLTEHPDWVIPQPGPSTVFKLTEFHAAAEWYRKSAEQNNAEAMLNLGILYKEGRGVTKDASAALMWWQRAYSQTTATPEATRLAAAMNIGIVYQGGAGITEDDREAAIWFRRAAEGGNPFAQGILARLYAEGRGVPKDPSEAEKWNRASTDTFAKLREAGQ